SERAGKEYLGSDEMQAVAVDLVDQRLGPVGFDGGVEARGVGVVLAHAAYAGKVEAVQQSAVLRVPGLVQVVERGGCLAHTGDGGLVSAVRGLGAGRRERDERDPGDCKS